ncbi:MAG TPA: PKD domain-containing protein [Solirubrobacteraceae bacterium]|nr:PKD domain-containing protein [Solirubrobacteraceae bacterium]
MSALALLVMSAPAAAKPLEAVPGQPPFASPAPPRLTADSPTGGHDAGYGAVTYQGGAVLHSNRTHLIFWEPSNHPELQFDPGYMPLMERFLRDVARASHSTHNVYGITGQYRDARGPAAYASTYAGAVLDTGAAPVSGCTEPPPPTGPPGWLTCLTDHQLQQELERVITADQLPTDRHDIYFLITPDGFGTCQAAGPDNCALGGSEHGGYCGYHSWLKDGVPYAVIPYNAVKGHCQSGNPRPNGNPADPALSTLSHEQAETITDPHQDAWYGGGGAEIADLCITSYGMALGGTGSSRWNERIAGGHFWLQELYSRITGGCAARPQPDSAQILAPAQMTVGRPTHLIARADQPGGRIVAYNWNFGDGHGGRGPSPQHTYREAGTFHVYLRVTDSAGNRAYAKRTVTIRPG